MIDKEKTCKDCPDRTVMPNCHSTCEGYLKRRARNDMILEAKRKANAERGFFFDRTRHLYKHAHHKNKR